MSSAHTRVHDLEGRPGRFRLGALLFLLAAAMIALSGCDGSGDADEPTAPPLETATERAPTGEPTPSVTPARADLPSNPDDYAAAAFEAWVQADTSALAGFAAAGALVVLEAHLPDDPDSWASAGCDAATGQLSCAYQGPGGETLMLLVDLAAASAAQPHAVIDAQLV